MFPHLYGNFRQCALNTLRGEGWREFYTGTSLSSLLYPLPSAGFTPALTARLAENTVIFAAYDYSKMAVARAFDRADHQTLNSGESMLAGGMAGGVAAFTRCPTELIKCRLQTMRELHPEFHRSVLLSALSISSASSGSSALLRDLLRNEGVGGLFTGYSATFLRQSLGNAVLFGCYETAREFARYPGERRDQIGIVRTMLCGGVSGVVYWSSIYPIDVLKSRIQVYGSGTLRDTFVQLIREDGFTALYKGLTPTLFRSFFSNAALLLTYEYTKKSLFAFLQ
ncbi:hypothetical protein M3Y99_01809800 [Aphelenchoides fujianensis]|nr:hypothetical protein M3Y99_01809800 [Aphelenchoides fujianensis]